MTPSTIPSTSNSTASVSNRRPGLAPGREDQLDVKTPPANVRKVDKIGVLLGPADLLDGVRVLEAFVAAHFEKQPKNSP